uniref:Prolamin-like domain-containing protein n=1 Tax=Salix viminalis TaxID=40686 RepID=A0A6N2KF91_SALVM
MASNLKLFLFAAVLACISLDGAKARPLASISNLSARLKLDEESPNCWDSLFQLQACTGEIVLFFLDGETRLGHSCCQALSTVGEHCWPNMIGTLGFTTEESQILEGYCEKAADSTTPSPSAPSVVPVKVVPKKTWVP